MRLTFIGIDPGTDSDNCPAVFVDEESGDLVFQGWTVTDTQDLAAAAMHSPLGAGESVVRLPARMRSIILEAVSGGERAPIQGVDRVDDDVSCAPGDARRLHTR
jgi:hypothetical protein